MLFVNGRFVTQSMSGVQRYAYNIVSRLGECCILSPGAPRSEYRLEGTGASVRVAGHGLKSHLWEQIVLPRLPGRNDILWSPAGLGPISRRNCALTIHDLAVMENPDCYRRDFRMWYKALFPVVAKNAWRIITISEFCKDRIVKLLGVEPGKVYVSHLGVTRPFGLKDPAVITPVLAKYGLARRKYILVVGAVSSRKNLARTFLAWQSLAKEYPSLKLVLVGQDGWRFSDLKSAPPVPPRTVRLSSVNDDELAGLYNGAFALLFPSLYEGFGLPMIEAMACGTPVVTSRVTALPEVGGKAAIYVDPYNWESIADGVHMLCKDSALWNRLRTDGLEWVKQFTWDLSASRIREVLLA